MITGFKLPPLAAAIEAAEQSRPVPQAPAMTFQLGTLLDFPNALRVAMM